MSQRGRSDSEVRAWFEARGWTASKASLADEEGVEGWRWSHPHRTEEFDAFGAWDEEPTVSEYMREFMARSAGMLVGSRPRRSGATVPLHD